MSLEVLFLISWVISGFVAGLYFVQNEVTQHGRITWGSLIFGLLTATLAGYFSLLIAVIFIFIDVCITIYEKIRQ